MDRHRIDPTHGLTPHVYTCPACGKPARMRVAWPFWECPHCQQRLIPADLYPRPDTEAGEAAAPAPSQEQQPPNQASDPAAGPRESWPQANVRPD